MVKFTAAMLVSRDNELVRRAVESVTKQRPDEFRAYIDSYILKDYSEVKKLLEDAGAKVYLQRYNPKRDDHHVDVVHAVHDAILEAENKWIAWIDDDDEMLSDRRRILRKYAADDVGIIHGDVLAILNGQSYIRRTSSVDVPRNAHRVIGSGTIYNRDAFKEIHDMVDHGYFWDYKIAYWMKRAGYRIVYVPQILSLQNVNTEMSERRRRIAGTWFQIADSLDRTPLRKTLKPPRNIPYMR